jgi:hypothetical protein
MWYVRHMTTTPYTMTVLSHDCTGPNRACRAAHRAGLPVHMIPESHPKRPRLIMPSYHFATVAEGAVVIADANAVAPTVATDTDLYRYRADGVAHFLPVGWIDPTRR